RRTRTRAEHRPRPASTAGDSCSWGLHSDAEPPIRAALCRTFQPDVFCLTNRAQDSCRTIIAPGLLVYPSPMPDDASHKNPFRAFTNQRKRPPPPALTATAQPTRIGHYAIAGTLGQGGMGIVYAARDERLGRPVALKTMTSLATDETARKRFWREARAAASVNHPNICQLYEIGEENGELFIAMELLEGEALAERLKRGSLNVSEALPVGLAVVAALAALHARGIIHRDLKPSNVFLTPHGVK